MSASLKSVVKFGATANGFPPLSAPGRGAGGEVSSDCRAAALVGSSGVVGAVGILVAARPTPGDAKGGVDGDEAGDGATSESSLGVKP